MQHDYNRSEDLPNTFRISRKYFYHKYFFCQKIGQGTYGVVYKIREKLTNKFYAAKIMKLISYQQLSSIQMEIIMLASKRHPYISSLKGYFIQKSQKHQSKWETGIIMELADYDLRIAIKQNHRKVVYNKLHKQRHYYTAILSNLCGLVNAFANLQTNNIAHRDIKPQNILIYSKNKGQLEIQGVSEGSMTMKIADFGLCIDFKKCSQKQRTILVGSLEYSSPLLRRKFKKPHLAESIKNNPFKDDVYSLGLCFLQLMTSQRIINHRSIEKLEQVLQFQVQAGFETIKKQQQHVASKKNVNEQTVIKTKDVKSLKLQSSSDQEDFFNQKTVIKKNIIFTKSQSLQQKAKQGLCILTKWMIQEQESQRPCFLQLNQYISENLSDFMYEQQQYSSSIKSSSSSKNSHYQVVPQKKQFITLPNMSIRCLKILQNNQKSNSFILCGCSSGQLIAIDIQNKQQRRIIKCGNLWHDKKYINKFIDINPENTFLFPSIKKTVKLQRDFQFSQSPTYQQFLMIGGNKCIVSFISGNLLSSLLTQVKIKQTKSKNIFKKSSQIPIKKQNYVEFVENRHYYNICLNHNEFKQCNGVPTSIYSLNKEHMLIGLSSGQVLMIWGEIISFKKIDNLPISQIELIGQNRFIISTVSGLIKIIDLIQTQPHLSLFKKIYCTSQPIISVHFGLDSTNKDIILTTINKKIIYLNQQFEQVKHKQAEVCGQFIDCIKADNNRSYILTEKGQILEISKMKILRGSLITKGWNCLTQKNNQFIFGSFQGLIGILHIENIKLQ